MRASVLLNIPLLALAFAQSSTNCRSNFNGYCCDGSIITSDGSSDVNKLICCVGDPVLGVNLGGVPSTCTAGTAAPLTQQSTIPNGIQQGGSTLIVLDGSTVVGGVPTPAPTVSPLSPESPQITEPVAANPSTSTGDPGASAPGWWESVFGIGVGWLADAL